MKINNQAIHLNDAQKQAVMHERGPLLVIAGAGSGKTRVITTRIAYLMAHHQVEASALIALTFTNKAATEMKTRIKTLIGNDHALPFVGTFHAYCVRLLKENRHIIETPFLSILDSDDQKKLIQTILQQNNLHKQIAARQAVYYISQMKNKNRSFEKPTAHSFDHPIMLDIYKEYEEQKRASKALDFDDLLLEAVRLFKNNQSFKHQFQTRMRHILIDEYQDTNLVQRELLMQMALNHKKLMIDSICAVGDEDQSIYSWRGATVTNMLNFQTDFPEPMLCKIEQNYRSVQPILQTANHIIKNNTQRSPKKLWSDRTASNRITLLTCLSEYQEADAITQLVNLIHQQKPAQDVAVLYRTHTQSRAIEESLLKHSIPYKIIGGIQFYERKEIKDLLAYIKLIVNPFDRASLFRIINTPARGLGSKFEQELHGVLKSEPFITFSDALDRLFEALPASKQKAIKQFQALFEGLSEVDKPSHALETIITRTGYLSYITKEYERDEADMRRANIQELLDAIKYLETHDVQTLSSLLEEIALMQEKLNASDREQSKVVLMTLHAAKGLEFDTIILAGLEQGILPTTRALYEDTSALEEERRLFYVGITRAKERLLIMRTQYRYTYGKMSEQMASQFIDELPAKQVSRYECMQWNNAQFRHYFAGWLGITPKEPSPAKKQTQFATIIKNKITQPRSASRPARGISQFKKNQPVIHKKYGTGIVQNIEQKSDNLVVIVRFRSGLKKIVSQFLEIL